MKHKIISPYQIRFTKKSRPADHIFVLKTAIYKYICKKKKLYTCFIDLKKFLTQSCMKLFTSNYYKLGMAVHFMKILKTCIANQSFMLKLGIFSQITSPPKLGLDRVIF
jgi:hypothetical protein